MTPNSVRRSGNGTCLAINLHELRKDAIEHNCSRCAVITCARLQPDFHLASASPTNYKELCVPWRPVCVRLSVHAGVMCVCVCVCVCVCQRAHVQSRLYWRGGGNMLTVTFPCCQDQSVSGKLMENTKPI